MIYNIPIEWIEIFDVHQHSFDFSPTRPEKLVFSVNFGGQFCIWNFGLEINKEYPNKFRWWSGNAGGRFLSSEVDNMLSRAIACCLRKHIDEIIYAGKTLASTKKSRISMEEIPE
jgi:hypothetical protein